ncbi:zinc metalloprotease [Actinospica robiniae]|uniref:zinc metalloprotease n=1 Tax=Actinospica robiniae TaxID=304901 RepID=UPI0003FD8D6B|nr:zinc metalloprotease [Actinospica robiniae]
MRAAQRIAMAGVATALLAGAALAEASPALATTSRNVVGDRTPAPQERQAGVCIEPPRMGFAGAIRDVDDPTAAQEIAQQDSLLQGLQQRAGLYPPLTIPGRPNELHAAFGTGTITIPVYVRDIWDPANPATKLTLSQINGQINVLNRAFAGGGPSAATAFKFEFRNPFNPYVADADLFEAPIDGDAMREAKQRYHVGGMNTLNVYFNQARLSSGDSLLGQATFPTDDNLAQDGIVVAYDTTAGARGGAMEGETAVHEVGHWLGLYHTFENGCATPGDYVNDTPPEAWAAEGCPAQFNLHNYMDYVDDNCMDRFTPDQAQRMADSWAAFRMAVPNGS